MGRLRRKTAKSLYHREEDGQVEVGMAFGKLTVVSKIEGFGKSWLCRCECGKELEFYQTHLLRKKVKSCGCGRNSTLRYEKLDTPPSNSSRYKDRSGCKYNMLTAIKFVGLQENSRSSIWEFQCDCGTKIIRQANQVARGDIKSCGCKKAEILREKFLLPDNLGIKRTAYSSHVNAAKKRNYTTELSFDDYVSITNKDCYYCGGKTERRSNDGKRSVLMNSVDRLNNEPYYNIKNSVPCCLVCQKIKTWYTEKEFLDKIKQIYTYRGLGD